MVQIPAEATASILEDSRKWPIGSRATDGVETYTVVATAITLGLTGEAGPILISDENVAAGRVDFSNLAEVDDWDRTLEALPADEAKAAAALTFTANNRESAAMYEDYVVFDDPTTPEQIDAIINFGIADREWREIEAQQRQAATKRAIAMAQVAWSSNKNQSTAARLLGVNQSSISRAVDTAEKVTGYHKS